MNRLANKTAIAGAAGASGGRVVRPSSAEGAERFTRFAGLVTAGHLLALARDAERPRLPRAVAAAFGAITVGDLRGIAALRRHATDDRHPARWTA